MQNSVERDYRRFAEKNAVLRYLSKVLVLVKERRKDSSLQMYESRLSYFNDKARINYCKSPSVHQMAAARGLVKTVIPVSLKPTRIRTLEYAFSI